MKSATSILRTGIHQVASAAEEQQNDMDKALLVAIAGDEFKTISAAEFASISSEDFEAARTTITMSSALLTATSRQMHLSKDERGQPTAQPGFGRSLSLARMLQMHITHG